MEVQIISDYSINEQIRDKEVRLIGEDGEQLGIVPIMEAQNLARDKNLDLVKIAPKAKPPVCKIIDYGKFKYEQTKKDKEARKKQNVVSLKEIRFSPNIEKHDLETKMKNAIKFLTNGDKVKVSCRFRGREMAHRQIGRDLLMKFAEGLAEIADIEKMPRMEGRSMTLFLAPKKTQV
jgi:translation initiation factor IF-3